MRRAKVRGARVRLGIAVLVAVVAGAAGLAVSSRSGDGEAAQAVGQGERAEVEGGATTTDPMVAGDPHWSHEALPPAPAPAGKEAIAFNDGGVPGLAGYIVDEGPNGWDQPDPVLPLGSGRSEARGHEITDLDGELLGYAVSGVGLVDLAIARDVGAMDLLLAEGEARRRAAEEDSAQMTEEEMARLFGPEIVGEDDG